MEAEIAKLVLFLALCGIGIALITLGCLAKEGQAFMCGIGTFILGAVLAVIIGLEWDSIVVRKADHFFETRGTVYACDDMKQTECEYSKKIWVRDSIEWAERVKVIMEK
jgi:hypothetical protein